MEATQEDVERRIRERAFALWQEAGCPEGRAEEFWFRAQDSELELAESKKVRAVPNDDLDMAGKDSFPASDPVNRTLP
jgi:hypothetical protein